MYACMRECGLTIDCAFVKDTQRRRSLIGQDWQDRNYCQTQVSEQWISVNTHGWCWVVRSINLINLIMNLIRNHVIQCQRHFLHLVHSYSSTMTMCARLRGSASPVLTATHHSYGSPRLSDFFPLSALGVRPLNGNSRKMAQTTCFHARMCLLQ